MKIWLSKNSEIPIYEQLTTQIIIGVASGDLPVGQRLSSTREIARRFGIHSNTVSNAYQNLVKQGWLEFRKGSGFYVSDAQTGNFENALDKLIAEFFQNARDGGFSFADIKIRLTRWFEAEPLEKILIIESDADLREILIEEIRQTTELEVDGVSFAEFCRNRRRENTVFAAMFDEKSKITNVLTPDTKCIFIKTRSAAEAMTGKTRPGNGDLIAVVSGWQNFLLMAKTMLLAADIDAESLVLRSTKGASNWKKGLSSVSMIICDSVSAKHFPEDARLRRFQIISRDSLTEFKSLGEIS